MGSSNRTVVRFLAVGGLVGFPFSLLVLAWLEAGDPFGLAYGRARQALHFMGLWALRFSWCWDSLPSLGLGGTTGGDWDLLLIFKPFPSRVSRLGGWGSERPSVWGFLFERGRRRRS